MKKQYLTPAVTEYKLRMEAVLAAISPNPWQDFGDKDPETEGSESDYSGPITPGTGGGWESLSPAAGEKVK